MANPIDVVILTESRYLNPINKTPYVTNVLLEDKLVQKALEEEGLTVVRKDWADSDFDWSSTNAVLFRTTWDYFDRIEEFKLWLERVEGKTKAINPISQIRWNMDKWYLKDLEEKGIPVVETLYLHRGEKRSLKVILKSSGWEDAILKPTVAGGGRHTYRINPQTAKELESTFSELIGNEDLMLQPFQTSIQLKGEVSLIVIGGVFTHSILKKAKSGDFRVQDDFGGSVHEYKASTVEVAFAERVVAVCEPVPSYARVDVMWNIENQLVVSEVELIEPELWFREYPEAAKVLARQIKNSL
tara:strand:- start:1482 stop:2381 length:900 start_codon:yes stop_codon:yes gene_type:complete